MAGGLTMVLARRVVSGAGSIFLSESLPAAETIARRHLGHLPAECRTHRLAPTQAANLALLVSAILARRTPCLSVLARAYATPAERLVAAPEHALLHRVKRLRRFLDNRRVDALAVQAKPRRGRTLGLAID
ncbi:MAG: hypothetical protein QOJ59_3621 [Thermomicrobiales bacterium]|jgi:hypothetical protein|nr:hypothetical protein [Thermomicrobiales bacterium]